MFSMAVAEKQSHIVDMRRALWDSGVRLKVGIWKRFWVAVEISEMVTDNCRVHMIQSALLRATLENREDSIPS